MKYLELSLATPEANLARDEALLDWCEGQAEEEVLCLWEASSPFVVVGYANQIAREVNVSACAARGVPILRRCSGGGAVIQGPGCLNYTLVVRSDRHQALASIPGTNRWIMGRHRQLIAGLSGAEVQVRGHTDLAIADRKFSGNAQRRRRRTVLFHGTFLLSFDLGLIAQLLLEPSQQPAYRQHRAHQDFVCNLPVPAGALKAALRGLWEAEPLLDPWPLQATEQLVAEKYSRPEWNHKF